MKHRRGRRPAAEGLMPHVWQSAPTLRRIGQLNEKYLAMVAASPSRPQLWSVMDERACKRAASIPVLLASFHFHDDDWWERIARSPVGYGPAHHATPLIREILVEAHMVARSQSLTARFVFDMSARVTASIAALSSAEIDWIANLYAADLRPRWEERAVFWQNLIVAAIGADDEALSQVHLYSIQLLGS